MRYSPAAPVLTVIAPPLRTCVMVTLVSWSLAPVSSVTIPARLAPIDCPDTGEQHRTDARRMVVGFIARLASRRTALRLCSGLRLGRCRRPMSCPLLGAVPPLCGNESKILVRGRMTVLLDRTLPGPGSVNGLTIAGREYGASMERVDPESL